MRSLLVAMNLFLAGVAISGCLVQDRAETPLPTDDAKKALAPLVPLDTMTQAGMLHSELASGAISTLLLNATKETRIDFPSNVFLIRNSRFSAAKLTTSMEGAPIQLLLPPGMTSLELVVDGHEKVRLAVQDTGHSFLQGENVLEWYKIQRDQFPNRCATCPNYARSQQYFASLFRGFGYSNVEVDPYGTNPLRPHFANVVAYRYPKTDVGHAQWLGVGGHYDVVANTREGALDDTAGTLGTLELARAFANLTTTHNLMFGLWGGEESGLQGSAFFTKTNPNVAAQMRTYVNLDASAFSYPAPRGVTKEGSTDVDCAKLPARTTAGANLPFACPDPVLVTAGPDGAAGDLLLTLMKKIQKEIMVGYPDAYFLYEYVGQGQAQGYSRVNAQSDHTSFIAAGVPSYMLINGDITASPVGFHNQKDTIENWTRYAYDNWYMSFEPEDALRGDALIEAERLVVQSIETYLWLTFYAWLHFDLGLVVSPAAGAPI